MTSWIISVYKTILIPNLTREFSVFERNNYLTWIHTWYHLDDARFLCCIIYRIIIISWRNKCEMHCWHLRFWYIGILCNDNYICINGSWSLQRKLLNTTRNWYTSAICYTTVYSHCSACCVWLWYPARTQVAENSIYILKQNPGIAYQPQSASPILFTGNNPHSES